jgi:hypothetical protein
MLPKNSGQTHEDRAREIEGALDWMRNKSLSHQDAIVVEKLNKLPSVPVSRRTLKQRAKDLDDNLAGCVASPRMIILQAQLVSCKSLTCCFPRYMVKHRRGREHARFQELSRRKHDSEQKTKTTMETIKLHVLVVEMCAQHHC